MLMFLNKRRAYLKYNQSKTILNIILAKLNSKIFVIFLFSILFLYSSVCDPHLFSSVLFLLCTFIFSFHYLSWFALKHCTLSIILFHALLYPSVLFLWNFLSPYCFFLSLLLITLFCFRFTIPPCSCPLLSSSHSISPTISPPPHPCISLSSLLSSIISYIAFYSHSSPSLYSLLLSSIFYSIPLFCMLLWCTIPLFDTLVHDMSLRLSYFISV